MGYDIVQVKKSLEKAMTDVDTLYTAPCINWTGKISGGSRYYSEVISELLIRNYLVRLNEIEMIGRNNYCVASHSDLFLKKSSGRDEENYAKYLKLLGSLGDLGDIIDYQVPLKNCQKDKAGKIDLVTLKDKNIHLIELKYFGNGETLLRTVLEIWTYYRQLNKNKFMKSYEILKRLKVDNIKRTILLGIGCNAFNEANELKNRPYLRRLIDKLEVEIFMLNKVTKIT